MTVKQIAKRCYEVEAGEDWRYRLYSEKDAKRLGDTVEHKGTAYTVPTLNEDGFVTGWSIFDPHTAEPTVKEEVKLDMPHKIRVHGRRWFDKVNGNTYFSVRVIVDGEKIAEVPYEYGYGEMFLQVATDLLVEKGIYPKTEHYEPLWAMARARGDDYEYTVHEVPRKKDLAW